MKVLFLSRHAPSERMATHLSEKFPGSELVQVTGSVGSFSGRGGAVSMEETLPDGTKVRREFSEVGAVVAVLPPNLLSDLLRTGVVVLRPLTVRKPTGKTLPNGDKEVAFEYVGLEKVERIEIVTSLFAGEYPGGSN